MKKKITICVISVFILIIISTVAYAAANDMSIPQLINSFIRYDFDNIIDTPDAGAGDGDSVITQDGIMLFIPVDVKDGWLYEFADGGNINVTVGGLSSGDRYIDIEGKNEKVRYLDNSASLCDGYTTTLFWSAKQQDGNAIVKDFSSETRCVVLYEFPDGSCYITAFIDGDGTDYYGLGLPTTNYYRFVEAPEIQNENNAIHSKQDITTLTETLLNAAWSEAVKITDVGETRIDGLISKDTAYLFQTTDKNSCEVIFPVNGYDYYIGVTIIRENGDSEWVLLPIGAVNVYDPGRWNHP